MDSVKTRKKCEVGCVCRRHFQSEEHKKKNSEGQKGKSKHSQESRDKIAKSNKQTWESVELRKRHSAILTTVWSDTELRRQMSEQATGRKHTPETLQKMSEASKKAWAKGERILPENMYRNSGGVHNGVWMRCLNSEGVFARELDRAGIQWLYEPRRFKTSLGSYLPDFYLPEFNIWIDVKGTRPEPESYAKMQAFRKEFGKCLVIVRQSELPSYYYKGGG